MIHWKIFFLNIKRLLKKYEAHEKKVELANFDKHIFENTKTSSELKILKNTLKSSEEKNTTLMRENLD